MSKGKYDKRLKETVLGLCGDGISYREIAQRTGVSKSTVARWCKGKAPIAPENLSKMPAELRRYGSSIGRIATNFEDPIIIMRLYEAQNSLREATVAIELADFERKNAARQ